MSSRLKNLMRWKMIAKRFKSKPKSSKPCVTVCPSKSVRLRKLVEMPMNWWQKLQRFLKSCLNYKRNWQTFAAISKSWWWAYPTCRTKRYRWVATNAIILKCVVGERPARLISRLKITWISVLRLGWTLKRLQKNPALASASCVAKSLVYIVP